MVCLVVALLILAFQYDASFPDEDAEEEEEEEEMMDEEKMDDMMMEEAGEGMEGGAIETRSKKSSAFSRSSSIARRRNALNMSQMSGMS